ncbi:hypothetical protein EW145_g3031 [Phellinidium pouzarii]|uniref:Glutathione S-transferase 3, mitochondrial n=1 Tax=Phellinidium pouzarii TaxID=167371 RepID=A0A4S4L8L4_9AGAM|nr:hypothetical protein EW145_g3031 [Phellinidium pouzarii]
MPSIQVPEGYSYAIAAASSTILLNFWQSIRVNTARKQAGIAYPQLYAEKAEVQASKSALIFNCTQRAHQNTLETTPHNILAILVTGLTYPCVAAGLGAVWVFGRVLYTIGYSTGEPSKRNSRGGFLSSLGSLGLMLATTFTVGKLVLAEL